MFSKQSEINVSVGASPDGNEYGDSLKRQIMDKFKMKQMGLRQEVAFQGSKAEPSKGERELSTSEEQKEVPSQRTASVQCERLRRIKQFRLDAEDFKCEGTATLEEKYEVISYVSKGAFGEILKLRDKSNNEFRAVKVISKKGCQKPKNFLSEIQILKKMVQ